MTMPDKPVGRKQIITPSPVKIWALENKIPVFTPENLKDPEFLAVLKSFDADFFVVVAYGKIMPLEVLDIPKYGAFNLHFSLLPKYRGASPLQAALLQGDEISGITIFRLTAGMDIGPMVFQKSCSLEEKTFSLALSAMTEMGNLSFLEFLLSPEKFPEIPQNEEAATYCHKIAKEDGEIFPERDSADLVMQKYRAFEGWPGVFYISKDGKRLKFTALESAFFEENPVSPGEFFIQDKRCFLALAKGTVEVISLIPEGKNEIKGDQMLSFLRKKE